MPDDIHLDVDQIKALTEKTLVGTTFDGRYVIEAEIGSGGMGSVFSARDTVLDRLVALKLLHPGVAAKETVVKRFQQEARVLKSLDHPSIVRTYAMGVTAGTPFIVMDLLTGTSMEAWIKENGALDLEKFRDVFAGVLEALRHAHSRGVVHRDIKPGNIIVDTNEDGRLSAKVLDFGIAKLLETPGHTALELTQTGELVGSPHYMSPEQSVGSKVDERSDIYSLCCVMYKALTGSPPFSGDNPLEIMYKHVNETAPDLVTTRGVPIILAQVINQGLQKDPQHRFQSIAEMADEIEDAFDERNALAPKAIKGRGSGKDRGAAKTRKAKRRNRGKAPLTTVVALIVAVGSVMTASWMYYANNQEEAAVTGQKRPTLLGVPAIIYDNYARDPHTSPQKFEELGEYAEQGQDFKTAMDSYHCATGGYENSTDALRCAHKAWNVIDRWKPYHLPEVPGVLFHLTGIVLDHKDSSLASTILNEWSARSGNKDEFDTIFMRSVLLARMELQQHRPAEALKHAELAYENARTEVGDPYFRYLALMQLVKVSHQLRSEHLSREVAAELNKHVNSETDKVERDGDLMQLAAVYQDLYETKEQEKYLQIVIDSNRRDRQWAVAKRFIAINRYNAGKFDQAEKLLKEVLPVFREHEKETPASLGYTWQLLGSLYTKQKRFAEAKRSLQLTLECYEKQLPEFDPQGNLAAVYSLLADIARVEADTKAAREYSLKADQATMKSKTSAPQP